MKAFFEKIKDLFNKFVEKTDIIGRVLFCVPLIIYGVKHFLGAKEIGERLPDYFPSPEIWIYAIGVFLLASAISILTKKAIKWGAFMLGIMLFLFVFFIHLPEMFDEEVIQSDFPGFLGNLGFMGAAFFISSKAE